MKHIESKQKIYETSNFGIFKHLLGNRDTVPLNIDRLYTAMRDDGWVGAPVVVNDHIEVIDGQNRIEAAKKCEENGIQILVPYIICPGYGIKECILLNRNVRNWNTTDYVHSYAAMGEDNYIWLKQIADKYPEFSMDILSGLAIHKGLATNIDKDKIRGGQLFLTDDEREEVEDTIIFLKDFVKPVKNIAGRVFITYNAILYYKSSVPKCDLNKLLNKVFIKNWSNIRRSGDVEEYLKQIDAIYNNGIKNPDNRIYAARQHEDERLRSSGK